MRTALMFENSYNFLLIVDISSKYFLSLFIYLKFEEINYKLLNFK